MKRLFFLVSLFFLSLSATLQAQQTTTDSTTVDSSENQYNKFLFLRFNKGQGYKKQGFEEENAYALLEKGVSYIAFNVGFKGNDIDNYWLEPIAVVDQMYNRNFSAHLAAGYFIKNNMAVGVKGSYEFSDIRLKVEADIFDILFDAEVYETKNVSKSFSTAGFIKNYVPLDRGHRFFLTNETGLVYRQTNSLSRNIYDEGAEIRKVEKNKKSIGISLSPGFMYFMTKGFAFDFTLSPVIAYYEHTKIKNNVVETGKSSNYGVSFKFMPLNIQFGFSYYFGLNYVKNKKHLDSMKYYN